MSSSVAMKCEHCGKDGAKLQCPKCKELGLPPSIYCEQSCFKQAWATHKAKHSAPAIKSMPDMDKALFRFTGDVRPGLLSAKRTVPSDIARPDYIGKPGGTSKLEEQSYSANKMFIWRGEDLQHIRDIATACREIIEVAMAAVRPGMTTDEIDRIVHDATVERRCYPSPLGYNEFPKSVCTSVNEIICHGIPDSRELQATDILNIDVSAFGCGGFHGDLNETIFVSKEAVSERTTRLLQGGYDAMMAGMSIVRPGALYKHIGDTISAKCDEYGYSVVRSICGHGIGRLFHCAPVVPHYANSRTPGSMKAGHVFTIEPMVCEGTHEDVQWPDDWTIATKDGKWCSMFEQMCLVTDAGPEILTAGPGYSPYFRRQLAEWGLEPIPAAGAAAEADAAVEA